MTTNETPVVLVVDDDEKLLDTYEMWLGSMCDLRMASSGDEALDKLDADVQVVLLDRLMPGLSGDQVLDRIRESGIDCRIAMVTAVEPDSDIAEMPFDAYVAKALDRETVVDTVERLVARADYDAVLREHYAVAEKLSAIEERKSQAELATDDAYQELLERFRELDSRLSAREEELDRDDIVGSIDAIDASNDGRADAGGSND